MRENLKYIAFSLMGLLMMGLTACTQGGETVPSYQYSLQDENQASLGYYTLQPQDTLLSVSQTYQVDLNDMVRLNDLEQPGKLGNGARIKIPAPRLYTVQPRDSLPRIAQLFDVTPAEIIKINHLSPPYQLRAGQVLRLSQPQEETTHPVNAHATIGTQVAEVQTGQKSHTVITRVSLPPFSKDSGKIAANPARCNVVHESACVPSRVLRYERMDTQSTHLSPAVITDMPDLNRPGFLTPVSGKIVSNFGPKRDGLHNDGVNISAARGTPVRAAQNGIVVYAGDEISGFGHLILIKHGGEYVTAYAHMDKMLAKKGDVIKRGQTIGTVGTSGHVAWPQLHFEIRKGKKAVNPTNLIKI